jgi:CubicO group peptidase (beta-lactamase class C family)
MRSIGWPFWALLAWPLCSSPSWGQAERPVDVSAIDALVEKSRLAWQVPGVAVGIVRNGEVIYLKGHGHRSLVQSEPVTPQTLFPIASCTKAFTTTLLAQLVEEGKLSWDDPPRKYVPLFQLSDPLADRAVTLRDLVCHRTGLASHDWLWHHAPWSLEESIRRAGLLPLDRPFRTAFQYQSTMFTVAGFAAARAGGAPWDELVRRRLLGPLGMSRTVCTTRAAQDGELAEGHRLGSAGRIEPMEGSFMETANPAGSIYSSASDLCRWLQFHLAEGKVQGRAVVSAASLAQTYQPQMVIPLEGLTRRIHSETTQLSYGMGWVVHDYRGRLLHSHAGLIDGFRAHLTLAPREGLGIVLLNNLHQTQLNQALCNSLLDLLLDLPRKERKDWNAYHLGLRQIDRKRQAEAAEQREKQRHLDTKPSHPLADYTGKYEHLAFGSVTVSLEGQQLVLSWRHIRSPLDHWHFDTFALSDPLLEGVQIEFRLDRAGRVASLRLEVPERLELKKRTKEEG